MKVTSTNIGSLTTIIWNGKEEQTGIYKYPSQAPLKLESEQVKGDTIANRKVHGGIDKACYLYPTEQYAYWKELYPDLKWDWGMFGENLTVSGLDEGSLRIGDIFEIGSALVQVSQPREPCYKLGVRFGNQEILKQFIDHGYPGAYVRVLKEGSVTAGDAVTLVERATNPLTVKQFFQLLYTREKETQLLRLAIANEALPLHKRERLKRFVQ